MTRDEIRAAAVEPVTSVIVCGTQEAGCICVQMSDHDGPHLCKCGGFWSLDADGMFRVDALPTFGPWQKEIE